MDPERVAAQKGELKTETNIAIRSMTASIVLLGECDGFSYPILCKSRSGLVRQRYGILG